MLSRNLREKQLAAELSHDQPQRRPYKREQKAFDQQLAHEASPAGSDGQADGELAPARRGSREK